MPYPQLISSVLSSACGQRQAETLSASFLEISGPSSGCSLHPKNQNYTVESSEGGGGRREDNVQPILIPGTDKSCRKNLSLFSSHGLVKEQTANKRGKLLSVVIHLQRDHFGRNWGSLELAVTHSADLPQRPRPSRCTHHVLPRS